MAFHHVPVLLNETINALNLKKGDIVVDATIGGGGHSLEILGKIGNRGKLHAIDRDEYALNEVRKKFKDFTNVAFHNVNFSHIKTLTDEKVDSIIADLGVSSHQIDTAERGFSYIHDAKLDMRMDTSSKFSAHTVVNNAKLAELEIIIRDYGEEKFYKRIAANIIKFRPVNTTAELAKICCDSVPTSYWKFVGHPAKKTFQAIRIAVNRELESLEEFLHNAVQMLKLQGRIAIITFHSLEDRIVKNTFKHYSLNCICPPKTPKCICEHRQMLTIITKKPVIPTRSELLANPRASSAKLRVAERVS